MTDPFATLGLPARPDLTDEQVRAARRDIAAATHPRPPRRRRHHPLHRRLRRLHHPARRAALPDPGTVTHAPAHLCQVLDIQASYNKTTGTATIRATLTGTTPGDLAAVLATHQDTPHHAPRKDLLDRTPTALTLHYDGRAGRGTIADDDGQAW